MNRPFGRVRALWGAALLLMLLLAACTTYTEDLLPAALTPPTNGVDLVADVGAADTGSFSFSSDVRTRYTVAVTAGSEWLTVTSGAKGNIKAGESKTVQVLGSCTAPTPEGEPLIGSVMVQPTTGAAIDVAVMLTCNGTTEPPPPSPPPSGGYTIDLIFDPAFTDTEQQAIFTRAAQRWEQIITGDVPNVRLDIPGNECTTEPAIDTEVNDVLIFAAIVPIDGEGGTLGRAGPCYVRSGSMLPVFGIMEFDSADVASLGPAFEDVILHEMGHVIGIGTIWEDLGLLDYRGPVCQLGRNIRFNGSGAVAEWKSLGGNRDVPVEDGGGAGTKCGHWKESVFDNELMTGYLNGSTDNPISAMTIASLGDLGYTVDLAAADPYALPSGSNLQAQGGRVDFHAETLTPIGIVSDDGTRMSAD